jgi:hypothetical protein
VDGNPDTASDEDLAEAEPLSHRLSRRSEGPLHNHGEARALQVELELPTTIDPSSVSRGAFVREG